jgi:hypothetical protein
MNLRPDQLGVILVCEGLRGSLGIDWHDPHRNVSYIGMVGVNGRPLPERPDARKGPVLVEKLATTLTFTVEPDFVALDVNDRQIYRWWGPGSGEAFKPAKARHLQVYGVNTADFLFEDITLEPRGSDAGRPSPPKN